MRENERSRRHELTINSAESISPLKTLPYGDSIIFPDSDAHFIAVGVGERVVVRELDSYPLDWETKLLLGMVLAAIERMKNSPDSIWRHRAQINTLIDLRLFLPMYRGLNHSIVPMLQSALIAVEYGDLRQFIKNELSTLLKEQVNTGGPTHFLDVNEMEATPNIAVLVPHIIELRRREIEEVALAETGGVIDLCPLVMTAWGFELVNVLGLGLETNAEGCDLIQSRLYELGLEVRIADEASYSPSSANISQGLKEYILSLVA